MFNKKITMPMLVIVVIVVIGFIQINIINTKALSPIGNTEDNYELVSEEFGEDFTEFIKDSADVKIYTGDVDSDASIKFKGKELRLKKENPFIMGVSTAGIKIKDAFIGIKGKVDNKIKDINRNNKAKENKNDELDSTVDDFIQGREGNENSSGNNEESLEENENTIDQNENSREKNESSIEKPKSEETNWEDNLE